MVAMDQPRNALEMFRRWTRGISLGSSLSQKVPDVKQINPKTVFLSWSYAMGAKKSMGWANYRNFEPNFLAEEGGRPLRGELRVDTKDVIRMKGFKPQSVRQLRISAGRSYLASYRYVSSYYWDRYPMIVCGRFTSCLCNWISVVRIHDALDQCNLR